MYSDFFKLDCLPFEDRADHRFYFARPDCEAILADLQNEIRHGKGMSLVVGTAGTGKTLLIRTLVRQLDASDQAVVLTWPADGSTDLIREAAKGFGVTLPAPHHRSRCLTRLRRRLSRNAERGRRSILIIDQAENLSSDDIVLLSTLTGMEVEGVFVLNVILVGQPHIRVMLSQPEFSQISQLLCGERAIPQLTREETDAYIRHRMQVAGAGERSVFNEEAVALIHDRSNGIPRLVNFVCHAALLAAQRTDASTVTRELVAERAGQASVRERSAAAQDVGMVTAEQVAAGLSNRMGCNVPAAVQTSIAAAGTVAQRASESVPSRGSNMASGADGMTAAIGNGQSSLPDDIVQQVLSKLEPFVAQLVLRRTAGAGAATDELVAATNQDRRRMNELIETAESIEKRLSDLVERGERLAPQVQSADEHAEALQAEVSTTLHDIATGFQRVSRLREESAGLSEVITALETRRADADELSERLDTLVESGRRLSQDIERRNSDAATQREQLQNAVTHAGRLHDGLIQATGAGRTVLDGLREGVADFEAIISEGHDTAERWKSQMETSEQAMKQLEALSTSAREIHDTAQSVVAHVDEKAGRLASHQAAATNALRRLSDATVKCEELLARVTQAESAIEGLVEGGRDQLNTLVQEVRDLGARTSDQAERIQGECAHAASLLERLEAEGPRYERLGTVAIDLINSYDQMKGDTDTAMAQLEAQITATEAAVNAGEPVIREFVAQCREIERILGDTHQTARQIEAQVTKATARPNEIVAKAERQIRQLERLCAATQRIGQGVSQAALDAKKQSAAYHRLTDNASKRVAALSTHSDRAVKTLRQWIEESARAQSRLEAALTTCPTIQETHSGDALRAAVADIEKEPEQAGEAGASRAQEISKLIEDAKRAAKPNGSPSSAEA